MDLTSLIGLLGGWTVIVVAVSAWLSRLLTERVLSKWRRDEQSLAEAVRAELARHNLLLEAGIRGFGAGQDVIRERRVVAVERLWAAVLTLRERLRGPVFFFGILLPSEYDAVDVRDVVHFYHFLFSISTFRKASAMVELRWKTLHDVPSRP